ncbi:MAG: transporter [Opitutaceae bacterium]
MCPICLGALLIGVSTVYALEGGVTAFPNGGEDFLVAAMPPPGWYGVVYLNRVTADRAVDGTGRMPFHRFDLHVNAVTPRLDWVKPVSVLGADRWGTLLVLPMLDLDLEIEPVRGERLRGERRGVGDLTLGNGLHWTLKSFEMVNAVDVVLPTGSFDRTQLVNPGRGQWVVRASQMGTWFPVPTWDLSYRLNYDHHFRNSDTHYLSGKTLYLNGAVGWKPNPATTVGLVGFTLRQVTDDRIHGQSVAPDGARARASGLGPVVRWVGPGGVHYTIKYLRDFGVRNRSEGEQLWVNGAFRF